MDYFASDQIIEPKKGDLLISEPYLADPNFERTVVFICEHDENGTFGFVLNRGASVKLSDLLDDVESLQGEVFIGGPVQKDTLHFLHRRADKVKNTSQVIADVHWGGDFDALLDGLHIKTIDYRDVRFFVGYSGWSPGQLMDEMKAKSWIVFSGTTPEMIFEWDNQQLWKQCLQSMGGKYRLISNYPKDPRLN